MSNIFIDAATAEFPLYEEALRARLGISEDASLPDTYSPVLLNPAPEYDHMTHVLEAMPPECNGGTWYVCWSIKELSEEQKQRNLLAMTKQHKVIGNATLDQMAGDKPDVIG